MNVRISKIVKFYFCQALVLALLLLGTGCGQLYRVKPLPAPSPDRSPDSTAVVTMNGLLIEARALDGDHSLEQFEGNLPMAGVLAIDLRLLNRSGGPINLGSLSLTLLEGTGQPCAELLPERALRRVMKFYGNRVYQIESHRETVESYRRIALSRLGELEVGEERRGILFYAIPPQSLLDRGFSLRVNRGGESISLAVHKVATSGGEVTPR